VAVSGDYAYVADLYYFEIFDCSQALAAGNGISMPVPLKFELLPPSPNPFNSCTAISFTLAQILPVRLAVYNQSGQEVQSLANGHLSLGKNTLIWNAGGFASGIYYVRLTLDGGESVVQKVILQK
jgi:hypothetical protein